MGPHAISWRVAPSPSRPFAERYLSGDLRELFALDPEDFETALTLPRQVDRAALADTLRRQAEAMAAPEAVFSQLERLAHPDSRVVVTGQQTGLLLGPLFTVSKAVTAIRLAEQLNAPHRPVVPIFWMATQDHDQEEIDHAYVLDHREMLHRVELSLPEDMPAGKILLEPAMVTSVLRQLDACEVPPGHLSMVKELLVRTAERSRTFGAWFGTLIYELLGSLGLVVLDPLDPAFARLFGAVLRKELADPTVSTAAIRTAGRRLRRLGEAPQLGRAGDATNLFLELSPGGQPVRKLLRYAGGRFVAGGQEWSRDTLLERLASDPTSITPAAGLRPVAQDAALPTVATVVGPGELRYFAQISGVFAYHEVAMPLIWPRAEALVIEPPVQRILAKYGLSAGGYLADPDGHRDRAVLRLHGVAGNFETALRRIDDDVKALHDATQRLDPTLQAVVAKGRRHMDRTVGRLREKTAAALYRRDEVTRRQFGRLEAHLRPLGQPQERTISPLGYVLKFGLEPFLTALEGMAARGTHVLAFDAQPRRDSE